MELLKLITQKKVYRERTTASAIVTVPYKTSKYLADVT